ALFEATNDVRYLDHATSVYALFDKFFFDKERFVVREFFDNALAPAQSAEHDIIEPGHMMEWAWLINTYARYVSGVDGDIFPTLYHRALKLGAEPSGFLADRVMLGAPELSGGRRLWPQTEYVRASIMMARRGDQRAAANGAQMINKLLDTYLNQPVAGLWCDQYHLSGEPAATDVPASILYHLYEATAAAEDFVQNGDTT
ncbi:MAG: AGE family epimerase/isomerase, partial [Hyphococcus sp.]